MHTWSSFLFDCILLYDVALNRFVVVVFVVVVFVVVVFVVVVFVVVLFYLFYVKRV